MRNSDRLAQFVEASLAQQHSRETITEALAAAGWSTSEIAQGLAAWDETNGTPPVPKPMPFVGQREFPLRADIRVPGNDGFPHQLARL